MLGARAGVHPNGLMFVLAGRGSHVAGVIRELFPTVALCNDAVVVPGLAAELPKWIERLAVSGPVWNSTTSSEGVPVILIDRLDAMTLLQFPTT